jgi:hypothetical protein
MDRQRGSVTLETTLVLPPLLFLVIFFLAALLHEQRLLVLSAALDQTAAEVSLAMPLAQVGADAVSSWRETFVQDLDLDLDPWLLDFGEAIKSWASDTVLEILIDKRLAIKLDQPSLKHSSFDRAVEQAGNKMNRLRQVYQERTIDVSRDPNQPVLWITCTWKGQIMGLPVQHVIKTPVPVWSIRSIDWSAEIQENSKDQVWMLDNFARGQKLRQLYGANLPNDFPVIARWTAGDAVVIHSIDLTAPTYDRVSEIRSAVAGLMTDLAGFNGCKYQRDGETIEIQPQDIQMRYMILVIPANTDPGLKQQMSRELQYKASQLKINLDIVTYGESHRYARE